MPQGARAAGQGMIDPATLMSIRGLEFRARLVVQGFWSGLHRSPNHGFSVEFTEYRPYTMGEDPRFLDWRLYARSDRFYLKKFEDETNVRCVLAVDNSRSMAYGSTGFAKADYAKTLAATLGYFLSQQGDAVGLMMFDNAIREAVPARNRTGHLRQLMLAMERETGGNDTDLLEPLRSLVATLKRRSMVVVISDFLAPLEGVLQGLALLGAARHEVLVFQVLDPVEMSLDLGGAGLLRDLETGRDLFVNPEAVRQRYQARLEAHNAGLLEGCRGLGMAFHRMDTSQPLELALHGFLREQIARRGGGVRRHLSR